MSSEKHVPDFGQETLWRMASLDGRKVLQKLPEHEGSPVPSGGISKGELIGREYLVEALLGRIGLLPLEVDSFQQAILPRSQLYRSLQNTIPVGIRSVSEFMQCGADALVFELDRIRVGVDFGSRAGR